MVYSQQHVVQSVARVQSTGRHKRPTTSISDVLEAGSTLLPVVRGTVDID